jgi:parvulin-like peptidyl-prolyl isomerase
MHCRFVAILCLAAVIEPACVELRGWLPRIAGPPKAATAQVFEDPGFGDPTTLGPASTPGGFPGINSPSNPYLPPNYGPTGPMAPINAVRPQSWPGGAPQPIAPASPGGAPQDVYRVATASPQPSAPVKKSPADPPYDPAEILAGVGAERIQACEVLPMINRAIRKAVSESPEFAKLSPEVQQGEIEKAQREYMKVALKELINSKLLVAELRATADKKALDENEKKIRGYFNSAYLKHLQEEYRASSIIDLENKLRAFGGSLESQRNLFVEQHLANGWLGQQVKQEDREPTHDEMLAYYREHGATWDTPARVRWEQISATYANFKTPQEARAALARWGNDVLVRGVPFDQVAKTHSQDYAADSGGVHDWSSKGSLRSAVLEEALFTLPVGAMSRILEDDQGGYIVRVLEREEARRAPFIDVQPEIRKQLQTGGESQRRNEYIESLRKRTPVWTVFDEEVAEQTAPFTR